MGARTSVDVERAQHALKTEGYIVIPGVVSKDRLTEFRDVLLAEYDRARSAGELFRGGGALSGHLNCYPGEAARFIYEEIVDAGVVDVVRSIDPAAVDRVRPTLNLNLPNSVAQHYHTDGLYTDAFVICNVAVVDTDMQNGAIDLLPATNRQFLKFWQYALQRRYRDSTRVAMAQGDVLLRMSTTWHRGMPNNTTTPRPLMSLTFGEESAPDGDPFGQNGGRIMFLPNWFQPSRLGRLRERTFVALPKSYSAVRFVRSLHGNRGYDSW